MHIPVAVLFAVLNQTLTGIALDPFVTKLNLAKLSSSSTVAHSAATNPIVTPEERIIKCNVRSALLATFCR